MTKVKICGNTNVEDAQLAASLGADYLGFIFAESKRRIDVPTAASIIKAIPGFQGFVGVFVNQSKTEVEAIAKELGLAHLQFHGDETALYCSHFMGKGYHVIKTFRIKDAMSLKRIDEYDVTAFLFDTYDKNLAGGTGVPFQWDMIENKSYVQEKLFLAGGLTPENVRNAIAKVHPYAVDVASGVEKEAGKKSPELLAKFISAVKGEKKVKHV